MLQNCSGCDSVCSFSIVGKKTAWAVAKTDNEIWDTSTRLSGFPEAVTETVPKL